LGAITHAGTYVAEFLFLGSFNGQPASVSDFCSASTPCTDWQFLGGGTGVIYVSDWPNQPNTFYLTGGNFTFRSLLPEPSTASLLLLGFAGLLYLGRRRRSRAMLLPAG